jgi:enoyl-CoA hydratase/carnithine racemase
MALFERDGVTLLREGPVFVLTLNRKENWINPTTISCLSDALDVVEAAEHPKALVITGTGKFFSNGLDIEFMLNRPADKDGMVESFWRFLSRLLVTDCHTVAAINGHAFGAGLFLALACDWRLMRTERGFVNFPELNLGMRLSKAFAELTKAKLSPKALRVGVLTGKRFSSADALAEGIIDGEWKVDELVAKAVAMANSVLPTSLGLGTDTCRVHIVPFICCAG